MAHTDSHKGFKYENTVKVQLSHLLRGSGLPWARIQSGSWLVGSGARKYKIIGADADTPDFVCQLPLGTTVWFDTKARGRTLSDGQQRFMLQAREYNGLAVAVYTLDDALAILQPWLKT